MTWYKQRVPRAGPIICAMEDSDASRHALRAATWLARGLEAQLLVAHAFDPMGLPARSHQEIAVNPDATEEHEALARQAAIALLQGTADTATGVELSTHLLEGRPVPQLRELAVERGAALLVTGTAGRGGLDRALIGSVSSELAATVPCPLVAVPRGATLEEPGPLVAGYDGSHHSLRAARHAAALAARLGRELVLLHVAEDGEAAAADADLATELYEAATGALGDRQHRPALDLKVRLAVEEGEPVQTLAAVARERAAALIVTGTRGRNALGAALLGSVSSGLVRAAGRPVVLVAPSAQDTPNAGAAGDETSA